MYAYCVNNTAGSLFWSIGPFVHPPTTIADCCDSHHARRRLSCRSSPSNWKLIIHERVVIRVMSTLQQGRVRVQRHQAGPCIHSHSTRFFAAQLEAYTRRLKKNICVFHWRWTIDKADEFILRLNNCAVDGRDGTDKTLTRGTPRRGTPRTTAGTSS